MLEEIWCWWCGASKQSLPFLELDASANDQMWEDFFRVSTWAHRQSQCSNCFIIYYCSSINQTEDEEEEEKLNEKKQIYTHFNWMFCEVEDSMRIASLRNLLTCNFFMSHNCLRALLCWSRSKNNQTNKPTTGLSKPPEPIGEGAPRPRGDPE